MRFVLDPVVLDAEDLTQRLIDRLVDRVAQEVHRIELKDLDSLKSSAWFQTARPCLQDVLLRAVSGPPRSVPKRGPHLRSFEVDDSDSLQMAERLAYTPFVILVEDPEADGLLLEILIEELGWPELRHFWTVNKSTTPAALRIENAGGIGNIPIRVDRYRKDAEKRQCPLRLFVMCDSDQRWLGDPEKSRKKSVDNVRDKCQEHGVGVHVLNKRNVENYIPDAVFIAARDDIQNKSNRPRFEAFLTLSKEQRDFFPLKDGLKQGELDAAVKAGLYQAAEVANLAILKEKLLPKGRPLKLLSEERRSAFTAEGLRARCGDGELDELLERIAGEL